MMKDDKSTLPAAIIMARKLQPDPGVLIRQHLWTKSLQSAALLLVPA